MPPNDARPAGTPETTDLEQFEGHTPGPWYWTPARTMRHLQSPSGPLAVTMPQPDNHKYAGCCSGTREFDAALVAAAPTLLSRLIVAESELAGLRGRAERAEARAAGMERERDAIVDLVVMDDYDYQGEPPYVAEIPYWFVGHPSSLDDMYGSREQAVAAIRSAAGLAPAGEGSDG